jgi:hypothetical protein
MTSEYYLDHSMKAVYPHVDYYRQQLTRGIIPMQLNLALIQPYIDTLDVALNRTEIEGVTHFSATVIDINDNGIHLQLGADVSARLKFTGDVAVKAGSTILFTADGTITEVTIPPVPERAPAQSSRRSPDKAMGGGICAARRD